MLRTCKKNLRRWQLEAELILGNAEELPLRDDSFDSVFHVGGINAFNDRAQAIHEMIRVAKPGTRILICDENEKGAQAYERFVPGFMQAAGKQREAVVAPVALIPPEMKDVRVFDVWNGWLYCIEFTKP